jgi:4-hydroxybenzoate polyprenyltransferase
MNPAVALKLGRVSNLPTVWTNTLAGVVLSGFDALDTKTLPLLLSMSLFYVGGMFLNDAYDAEVDSRERPERPIPAGLVRRQTVFAWGFAMLASGLAILLGVGLAGATGLWPAAGGLALGGAIIVYDRNHKANPLSPLIMGVCRMLVYITAGLCFVAPVSPAVLFGAFALLAYLIGLTYTAKQENIGRVENAWPLVFLAVPVLAGLWACYGSASPVALAVWLVFTGWLGFCLWLIVRRAPGDIPRSVGGMIAGIALLDAMLISAAGASGITMVAIAGFALTLLLQRFIPGT